MDEAGVRLSPHALDDPIDAPGIGECPFIVPLADHQTFLKHSGKAMTFNPHPDRPPPMLTTKGWQYKAAFVILFRPETDIEDGRFEGRVEHVASHRATKFHSLDELLDFVARVLAEIGDPDE